MIKLCRLDVAGRAGLFCMVLRGKFDLFFLLKHIYQLYKNFLIVGTPRDEVKKMYVYCLRKFAHYKDDIRILTQLFQSRFYSFFQAT